MASKPSKSFSTTAIKSEPKDEFSLEKHAEKDIQRRRPTTNERSRYSETNVYDLIFDWLDGGEVKTGSPLAIDTQDNTPLGLVVLEAILKRYEVETSDLDALKGMGLLADNHVQIEELFNLTLFAWNLEETLMEEKEKTSTSLDEYFVLLEQCFQARSQRLRSKNSTGSCNLNSEMDANFSNKFKENIGCAAKSIKRNPEECADTERNKNGKTNEDFQIAIKHGDRQQDDEDPERKHVQEVTVERQRTGKRLKSADLRSNESIQSDKSNYESRESESIQSEKPNFKSRESESIQSGKSNYESRESESVQSEKSNYESRESENIQSDKSNCESLESESIQSNNSHYESRVSESIQSNESNSTTAVWSSDHTYCMTSSPTKPVEYPEKGVAMVTAETQDNVVQPKPDSTTATPNKDKVGHVEMIGSRKTNRTRDVPNKEDPESDASPGNTKTRDVNIPYKEIPIKTEHDETEQLLNCKQDGDIPRDIPYKAASTKNDMSTTGSGEAKSRDVDKPRDHSRSESRDPDKPPDKTPNMEKAQGKNNRVNSKESRQDEDETPETPKKKIRKAADTNEDTCKPPSRDTITPRDSTQPRDHSPTQDSIKSRDITQSRDQLQVQDTTKPRDSTQSRDHFQAQDTTKPRDNTQAIGSIQSRDSSQEHDRSRSRDSTQPRDGLQSPPPTGDQPNTPSPLRRSKRTRQPTPRRLDTYYY